jgi:DNA-binding IclR family transcriptional regulator
MEDAYSALGVSFSNAIHESQGRGGMIESPSKGVTIQSVERAVAVIGAFIEDGTPLSVSEVASRTRLAPATVHRLLTTLVRAGWLEQDHRSSRYELSVGLLGSAAIALASSSLLRHGQYFLSQVSQATGLNSFVAVLRGRTSVLLARAQGREGSASDFQVGKANPLHASASGKLFLAVMSPAQRDEMLSALGELRRFTANTIVDPERFRDEMEHIREVGYAVDNSELYDSYHSRQCLSARPTAASAPRSVPAAGRRWTRARWRKCCCGR